jgi:hypothetical protein
MEYDNNHFIIASRAYSLHCPLVVLPDITLSGWEPYQGLLDIQTLFSLQLSENEMVSSDEMRMSWCLKKSLWYMGTSDLFTFSF